MNPVAENAGMFDAYNARSLTPEDVAKNFVLPKAFDDLAERTHATVIGPRGSGKTSLLKMLDPRALQNWTHSESRRFREKIAFTGVFIPTDISWNRQTSAIVDGLNDNLKKVFRNAAFTTHVLHELLDVCCWRCERSESNIALPRYRSVSMLPQVERLLAQKLATAFDVSPSTDSLIGIKHALALRQAQIWELAQAVSLGLRAQTDLPTWVVKDMLSLCSLTIEYFDDAAKETTARWALLFDELELAPEWIFQGLQTALRSTNPKLIYKLAISPFNEAYEGLRNALQAVPGQDYSEIRLWYEYKDDALTFSRALTLAVLEENGFTIKDVSQILGTSVLEYSTTKGSRYTKDSPQIRILKEAIKNDPTFATYWSTLQIDVESLASLTENERAAKVRKIFPLVAVRNYFRPAEHSPVAAQQQIRGRKSLEIYCGASGVLTMMEGNPRWVIGITKALIQQLEVPGQAISRAKQASVIEIAMHRFRARLKTINIAEPSFDATVGKSLLRFIDAIGHYFTHQLIVSDFQPQPPQTFIVDATADVETVTAIGRALNVGALVYVPDKTSMGLLSDVKGKRFRLSYLLVPEYSLPLRLGPEIALSRILQAKLNRPVSQPELDLEETT